MQWICVCDFTGPCVFRRLILTHSLALLVFKLLSECRRILKSLQWILPWVPEWYISFSHSYSAYTRIDQCGNVSSGLYSYVQIGQGSGVLSDSSVQSTSYNSHLAATITVSNGTTVVITSFIPTSTVSNPHNSHPASMDLSSSFWDSTSKVAGVFVPVGLVIAILAMAIFWMCRSRKNRKDEEKPEEPPQIIVREMSGSQSVSRSASLLQLLGRRERNRKEELNSSTSNGNNRLSRTPTDLVVPVVDQRLDPQSMMIRFDDNDSRTSFRDEEDYSRRVWRVTNASDSDSLRSAAT